MASGSPKSFDSEHALERYGDTVVRRIREGLDVPRGGPFVNLRLVLRRTLRHHSSPPRVRPRDLARALVGLIQGTALVGRVTDSSSVPRSMVEVALIAVER